MVQVSIPKTMTRLFVQACTQISFASLSKPTRLLCCFWYYSHLWKIIFLVYQILINGILTYVTAHCAYFYYNKCPVFKGYLFFFLSLTKNLKMNRDHYASWMASLGGAKLVLSLNHLWFRFYLLWSYKLIWLVFLDH